MSESSFKYQLTITIISAATLGTVVYMLQRTGDDGDVAAAAAAAAGSAGNTSTSRQDVAASRRRVVATRPAQPVCLHGEHLRAQLRALVVDVQVRRTLCLPCERKYTTVWRSGKDMGRPPVNVKPPARVDDESRGIGVVWCVVGLLILSVIASIIDVLNAKAPKIKKTSSIDIAGNPAAAPRRCSLASLTVSRNPKRQLFGNRRSSSMAEGSSNASPPAGMPTVRAKFD